MKSLVDDKQAEALDLIERGLDMLAEAGLEPADGRDATTLIKRAERIGRRVDAVRVKVVDEIDRTGVFAEDGHYSAKIMVRHVAKLSNAEAAARAASAKALRDLPSFEAGFADGQIGTCQVRRIAKAHSNKRVRDQLIEAEGPFATIARLDSYAKFHEHLSDWTQLADEDGTADTSAANHRNRKFQQTQELDQGWVLRGRCGAPDGIRSNQTHQAYIKIELQRDFDLAREKYGPDVKITKDMLERTDDQRSWDAYMAILDAAGEALPASQRSGWVTAVVLDETSWRRELDRWLGLPVERRDPFDPTFRCETLDGARLHPREAFAISMQGRFRRAVIDARDVTINLSRSERFFVRHARLAVQLSNSTCMWPGCEVPTTACEIDHITGWAEQADGTGGGHTCPENGEPFCGYHNRKKEHGYRVIRGPDGRPRVYRADGTEIE